MSSDIYAKPDFSKKVRYNRKVQEDDVEWEERTVAIYESTDDIKDDQTELQSHNGGPHTENHPPAVQRRPFRAAAFCLGVLCFLMITGIILLYIRFTLEKDQLQIRYDKLYNNYSELQGQISKMTVNNGQLQDELKQLKDRLEDVSVTLEKDQLQARYDKLYNNYSELQGQISVMTVNNSQLQDEVKQLKDKIEGKWCPEGWKRFGCSCYFKANEKKYWSESRSDCQEKGADLVIINNEEEQKFIIELNKNGDSWIGLWRTQEAGWEWEWVDSSPLTETFWATEHQNSNHYYSTCCDHQGKWTSRYNNYKKNWICEK